MEKKFYSPNNVTNTKYRYYIGHSPILTGDRKLGRPRNNPDGVHHTQEKRRRRLWLRLMDICDDPDCNTMSGYSGRRPGYSGHGVSKSSKFFNLGPTTIKTNSSLSQLTLTLTLSRYSLSLSLPQEPSLSPNSRTQKSPSQINPKTKKAQISVGDHLLQIFHHGVASFLSFLARRACSRY